MKIATYNINGINSRLDDTAALAARKHARILSACRN
jgi:exonuclease III